MALVIDGSGDITGLTTGAIESTAIGTGAIRQVTTNTYTTVFSSATTGSWLDIGFSGTITPSTSSSRILINLSLQYYKSRYGAGFKITRNGTDIYATPQGYEDSYNDAATSGYVRNRFTLQFIDSPTTTSPVVYRVYVYNYYSGTVYVSETNTPGYITLMEIA